jgi:isoquinoline 1-oxidoreductase subunit beta
MMKATRSDFIKEVAAFGGMLALAVGVDGCSHSAATAPDFQPNAWLIVHPDNTVTIFVAKSEMGQGVATGMPTLVAEELDISMNVVRVEFAQAAPPYQETGDSNLQMTAASDSTALSWLPLRRVGATARAMLVAAAAKEWNVDPSTCTTTDGRVSHAASNRTTTYGSLTAAASQQPVPTSVTLKQPDQFTLIGKTFGRLDIPLKINGSAQFGIDVRVPGMRFASIEQPPTFGGSVKSFEATHARQVPGVIDVVQVPAGIAVVASNSHAAFTGRQALHVVWNPGPNAHLDSDKLAEQGITLATSRHGAKVAVHHGDVTAATGRTLEAIYQTPYLAHAAMEPISATASVTDTGVEVWAPTQAQTLAQAAAARIAGVPVDKVILHTTYIGGAFGRRLMNDYVEQAVMVSKAIKAPVQVIWTRPDDTKHDFYRPMSTNALRGVLDASGNLIALDHLAVAESCLRSLLPERVKDGIDPAQLNSIRDSIYEIPNYRGSYTEVEYGIPATTMRAPGANSNAFASESFLDELAHAAGRDPLAFRLALFKQHPRAAGALRAVAQHAAWGRPRTPGAKQGIAFSNWAGTATALVAEVTMQGGQPIVHRVVIAADPGIVINPNIVEAQMQGSVNYGLSMAMLGNITIKNGVVQQDNFDNYPVLQMKGTPDIETVVVPSSAAPSGIGEVGVPPIAPAIGNAIFALTGKRVRTLPFKQQS